MSQFSAQVDVCITEKLPGTDGCWEKSWCVCSPPKAGTVGSASSGKRSSPVSAGGAVRDNKVWRPVTVMLRDEGLRMGGEAYSILDIAGVQEHTDTNNDCDLEEMGEIQTASVPTSIGCNTPETEATMGSASPAELSEANEEFNVSFNKEEDNNNSNASTISTKTASITTATLPSEGNNKKKSSLLDLIKKNENRKNSTQSHKIICVFLHGGEEGMIKKAFRYRVDDKDAERLVDNLRKVIGFIMKLRVFFTNLKTGVEQAELLKRKHQLEVEKQQQYVRMGGVTGGDGERGAGLVLTEHEEEVLKIGFGLQELSMLEEAIAYCPVTACMHLKNLHYLKEVPYEGHRSRQKVLALKSFYESLVAPKKTQTGICKGGGESNSVLSRKSTTNETGSSSLKLFSIEGGESREAKAPGYCEDATFVLNEEATFGVFDGVGSWALEGIDASKFSTGMAECCTEIVRQMLNGSGNGKASVNCSAISQKAKTVLKLGHQHLIRSRPYAWGSSTAIVAILDRLSGRLGIACLGDSVLMILRRGTVTASPAPTASSSNYHHSLVFKARMKTRNIVYRTKEQRWYNGAPYQLANLPPREEWEELRERGYERFINTLHQVDPEGDSPDQADVDYRECQPGDLILLMTDGVSDNLFDDEIAAICSFAIDPEEAMAMGDANIATDPQDVARTITNAARRRSHDQVYSSAFVPLKRDPSRRRQHEDAAYNPHNPASDRRGGKRDDISCVACWVKCETEESIRKLTGKLNTENSASSSPIPASSISPQPSISSSSASSLSTAATADAETNHSNGSPEKTKDLPLLNDPQKEQSSATQNGGKGASARTPSKSLAQSSQIGNGSNKGNVKRDKEETPRKPQRRAPAIYQRQHTTPNKILRSTNNMQNSNIQNSFASAIPNGNSSNHSGIAVVKPSSPARSSPTVVCTPKQSAAFSSQVGISNTFSRAAFSDAPAAQQNCNTNAKNSTTADASRPNSSTSSISNGNDDNKKVASSLLANVFSSFCTSTPCRSSRAQGIMTPLKKSRSLANQRFLETEKRSGNVFVGTPAKKTPQKSCSKNGQGGDELDDEGSPEGGVGGKRRGDPTVVSDGSDVESPFNADMTPRKCRRITRMYKNARLMRMQRNVNNVNMSPVNERAATPQRSCTKRPCRHNKSNETDEGNELQEEAVERPRALGEKCKVGAGKSIHSVVTRNTKENIVTIERSVAEDKVNSNATFESENVEEEWHSPSQDESIIL